MVQILHKRASTTERIRIEIQQSEESLAVLAARYHINIKTVAKWRRRDHSIDAPMGAKAPRSVLTAKDEEMILALREKTKLSLDDCYIVLKENIPRLTRSNLHRCLKRHGVSVLPKEERPKRSRFKKYPIGYFHLDICDVRTQEGKCYLYVAVDRTCKFVYAGVYASPTIANAVHFLDSLVSALPYRISKILTDNGAQFTYNMLDERCTPKQQHPFARACDKHAIEHRLTKFRHPWTNGQVERMNRTLKEATIKKFHYDTTHQLKQHLHDFIMAYNFSKKLKTLNYKTPYDIILQQWKVKPNLFNQNPYHYCMGLNS
jgi:transposase InsO family protein